MSQRLHTYSEIFFPCSYMLRVRYSKQDWAAARLEHRNVTKTVYKGARYTWGHSGVVSHHNVENARESINQYGYYCFSDDSDALHIRLSIDNPGIRLYMWPETKFTIHEYD